MQACLLFRFVVRVSHTNNQGQWICLLALQQHVSCYCRPSYPSSSICVNSELTSNLVRLLQREAEQEAARLSAIQDAKQREFEEREAKAAAELKHRLEVEQRTIAEQQQRQRTELKRQRR